MATVILVYAPKVPSVPAVVTPVVYSVPPLCVPFAVVLNLNGCVPPPAFEASDCIKK